MRGHLEAELLSVYLDDEMTPFERRRVEAHLEKCAGCSDRLAGLRSVAERVRRLERLAPPPELGLALARRVSRVPRREGWLAEIERALGRLPLQSSLGSAFGLVVALAAIVLLFAHGLEREASRQTGVVGPPAVRVVPAPQAGAGSVAPSPVGRAAESPAAARRPAVAEPAAEADAPEGETRRRLSASPPPLRDERLEDQALRSADATAAKRQSLAVATPGEVVEIAGRGFVRDGEGWRELGMDGEPQRRVLAESAEGEALLREHPELAPLADLGGRVLLEVDGERLALAFPE